MKTEDPAPQNWEDIVFENRNKSYGAYLLRKIYNKNVLLAWTFMLVMAGLAIAYPSIASFFRSRGPKEDLSKVKQTVVNLDQPPPIMPNQPPPPRLEVPPPVKTLKYVAPKVTKEEVVEEIPTIEEIKKTEISTETTEGPETVVFQEPVKAVVSDGEDNSVHMTAEQPPEFPGGLEALYKFIKKTFVYPKVAQRQGIEGKVYVNFVVNKDGSIVDVQVIKGLSAECDKEALRVISMMPAWKAGKQNGKPVRVKFVVPITYKLN